MVEKQKQLFALLKEIDAICKNNGIEYVLAGGTLIGAIRHRGFLPWDDDVDIMMTRDNWEKLKEAAKTQLPPNRALLAPEIDSVYTNGFPRYMDTSVTAIHTHQIPGKDKAGEIIDVLILDPIPDDEESHRQYIEEMMMYSELVNDGAVFSGRWEVSPWKYIKYKIISWICGKKYVLNKIENKIFSYPEEQCNYYAMRWGGVPFKFEKRWYEKVKLAPFEDIMGMIPQATNEYLTWHYGDEWMYVPPVGERESHKTVSNTEVEYQKIQQEYLHRISISRFLFESVNRKIRNLATAKKNHSLSTGVAEMQAYSQKIKCETKLLETGVSPADLTAVLPASTLAELFNDYFVFQLGREIIGREDWRNIYRFNHPVLVDLEPDFFYAAVYTLFSTNRIAKAMRLLEIWKQHHDLTDRLAQIENSIQTYRRAANLFMDEEKPHEAEKLMDGLLSVYPNNISFWKLKLQICSHADNDEWKSIFKKCLDIWPEDGEFIKYQADLTLQNEDMQKAFPIYLSAYKNTNNGLIQLSIADTIKKHFSEILLSLENDFDSEITDVLEKIFYNQQDILQQLYILKIRKTEDIGKVNKIIRKLKADEYYYDTLKEAFLYLGVSEDAVDWKLEKTYNTDENSITKLLNTVLGYRRKRKRENVSASVWKLLGDLHYRIGKEKEAFKYYRLAVKADLCDFERYEICGIVNICLWNDDAAPIRSIFKKRNSFFKWYHNLYQIPDSEEIEDDEITTDTVSVDE